MDLDIIFLAEPNPLSAGTYDGPASPDDQHIPVRCLSAVMLSTVKALRDGPLTSAHLALHPGGMDPKILVECKRLLDRCPFDTTFLGGDSGWHSPPPTNSEEKSLVGPLDPYHWASQRISDMVFFVEADCLLAPEAVGEMVSEYSEMTALYGQEFILVPHDMSLFYGSELRSLLIAGLQRYWRTIPASRRTILLSRQVLHRLFPHPHERDVDPKNGGATGPNQNGPNPAPTTDIQCLAPMPALAAALQSPYPPPFTAWRSWYESSFLS